MSGTRLAFHTFNIALTPWEADSIRGRREGEGKGKKRRPCKIR